MDEATLKAYDRDPGSFAEDWETQPPPSDLYATVQRSQQTSGAVVAGMRLGSTATAIPPRDSTLLKVCCVRPGSGIRILRLRQLRCRSLR